MPDACVRTAARYVPHRTNPRPPFYEKLLRNREYRGLDPTLAFHRKLNDQPT
jgi:hypothetical protein